MLHRTPSANKESVFTTVVCATLLVHCFKRYLSQHNQPQVQVLYWGDKVTPIMRINLLYSYLKRDNRSWYNVFNPYYHIWIYIAYKCFTILTYKMKYGRFYGPASIRLSLLNTQRVSIQFSTKDRVIKFVHFAAPLQHPRQVTPR